MLLFLLIKLDFLVSCIKKMPHMDRGHIAYLSYILTSSLLSILGPSGRLMWLNLPPARHRCSVRPPTSEQKKMYKIDSYGKKNCTGVFSRSKLTNDVRVSHQNTPDFGFGEFFPKKINFTYSPSVQSVCLYRSVLASTAVHLYYSLYIFPGQSAIHDHTPTLEEPPSVKNAEF